MLNDYLSKNSIVLDPNDFTDNPIGGRLVVDRTTSVDEIKAHVENIELNNEHNPLPKSDFLQT